MRERVLAQKRASEARRRANRRDEVLEQKRAEQRRNREGYRERQKVWRDAHPDALAEQQRRARAKAPEKARARDLASSIEMKECAVCGSTNDLHRHHPDYSRPRDVVVLCRTHHGEAHR
jgi:hypothetical protein